MRDMRKTLVVAGVATAALVFSLVGCGGSSAGDASGDTEADAATEQATDDAGTEAEPEETGAWVMSATRSSTVYDYGDESTSTKNDVTLTLDDAGNVLSSTRENTYTNGGKENSSSSTAEYTYDEQGLAVSSRTIFDENNDNVEIYGEEGAALYEEREKEFPETKYEYEFDDEGRPTKRTTLTRQGDLGIVTSWSYDADGNKTGTEAYLDEDAADPTYDAGNYLTYTYDDAGNIASIYSYQKLTGIMDYYDDDETHTDILTTTTTYDEHGFATMAESTTEHDDGVKETSKTTYKWKLGDDGKPLSLVRTTDNGNESGDELTCSYSYDDEGNLSSEVYDATYSYTNDKGEAASTKMHTETTYEWVYVEEPSLAVRLATHLFARSSLSM